MLVDGRIGLPADGEMELDGDCSVGGSDAWSWSWS